MKTRALKKIGILVFNLSYDVFILLLNVKIPTPDGVFTFLSRINFMLSLVEHENTFITSRPGNYLSRKSILK